MDESEFGGEVRSFVTCALAMTPDADLAGDYSGTDTGLRVRFNNHRKMSDHEHSSLEELLSKLESLQDSLPDNNTLTELKVTDSIPSVEFQPNTRYELVTVDAQQLEIAKDVARRIQRIKDLDRNADSSSAKAEFDRLQEMLAQKRKELIGSFASIRDLDDAVGMHAIGGNGAPQLVAGGPLIFVLIEIYLS